LIFLSTKSIFLIFLLKKLDKSKKCNIIKVTIKKINEGVTKMVKDEVLTQLNQKQISTKKAYQLLYPKIKMRKPRRASFVKLKIHVPDSRAVNIFLKILLLLPIPIFIIKWVIRKRTDKVISDQFQITTGELIHLISVKGVKIDVDTHTNERILIKTI